MGSGSTAADLAEFYGKDVDAPGPFAGQLATEFQQKLRAAHAGVEIDDCHFYHSLVLGGGEVIPGGWDLRGNENNYTGHIDYRGMKVLEFGPASGYVGFWVEEQGADLTIFDLPPGHGPNLLPMPGIDLAANAASGAETAARVRDSWWYAHRSRGSDAKAVYGDIYALPPDIGRYDVSVFGSILLHLADPFAAMRQAAAVTDRGMVVTDILPEVLFGDDDNSLMEFNPGDEPENLVNWWRCSPGAIRKMLGILGFAHVDVHFHQTSYHPHHDTRADRADRFMFTAVGQREPGLVPRLEKTCDEKEADARLKDRIPVIDVENHGEAHRMLQEANAKLDAIYHSAVWKLAWKMTKPLRLVQRLTGRPA